jgi:hypothetical protein
VSVSGGCGELHTEGGPNPRFAYQSTGKIFAALPINSGDRSKGAEPRRQRNDLQLPIIEDQWRVMGMASPANLVGRIYEHPSDSTLPQLRWFWSIIAIEPPIPNVTNGHAPTLNEAKSKFRAAWEKAEQAAKHARRRAKSAA